MFDFNPDRAFLLLCYLLLSFVFVLEFKRIRMESASFNVLSGASMDPHDLLRAEGRAALAAFYHKAWGRSWPHHYGTIRKTQIGQLGDDDGLYIDGGIADRLDYLCLDGIKDLLLALCATVYSEDIIIVRAEYESVRKMLENSTDKSFVVTGQPGIGKTFFLIYLLLYRLERKLPTAIQVGSTQYFIFDEHGAAVNAVGFWGYDERLRKCWALCDSNIFTIFPCQPILAYAARVIQTPPPSPDRWKVFRKQFHANLILMDLPTVMEIAAVLKELKLDVSATLGHVGKWGPCIRTTVAVTRSPILLEQHQLAVQCAAALLAKSPDATFVYSVLGDIPNDVGSNILFLRPHRQPDRWAEKEFDLPPLDHWQTMAPRVPIASIPTKHLRRAYEAELKRVPHTTLTEND